MAWCVGQSEGFNTSCSSSTRERDKAGRSPDSAAMYLGAVISQNFPQNCLSEDSIKQRLTCPGLELHTMSRPSPRDLLLRQHRTVVNFLLWNVLHVHRGLLKYPR